jgi:hypothetical protein
MNIDVKIRDVIKETYILTGKIDNKEIIKNLTFFIKNYKNIELSYKTNVQGTFTGFKSLIQNDDFINFLKIIQENIKVIYKYNFVIQDAWGNICKKGDEVLEHDHGGVTGFCGILYLTENGPGTYFREHDLLVNEEIGKFILFSPILKHSVKKIENDIERITVAFNMDEVKKWADLSNVKWVNKNEI